MSTVIEIEGNVVRRIEKSIVDVGSTDDFIQRVSKMEPFLIEEIPFGCIGVGRNSEEMTYFIYMKPGICSISDSKTSMTPYKVFIPHSIFSICINKGGFAIPKFWHLLKSTTTSLSGIQIYKHILPNMGRSNDICIGKAASPAMSLSATLKEKIYGAIDLVLSSNFNWDLIENVDIHGRPLERDFWIFAKAKKEDKTKTRIEEISKQISKIENSNWEEKTEDERWEARTQISALQAERTGIKVQAARPLDWREFYLGYLAYWTERNAELIETDPDEASRKILEDEFGFTSGMLGPSGAILYA